MAIYEMGPFATAVEQAMIEELGAALGLGAGELFRRCHHGGSLADTGLLTARNVVLGGAWEEGMAGLRGAIGGPGQIEARRGPLGSCQTHYSVARAAGILGIGAIRWWGSAWMPVDGWIRRG